MPEISDPKQIAIVATTYFPTWYGGKLKSIKHTDKVRGDLALESAHKIEQLGYHLVVADGKSTKTFRQALQAIPGIIVAKRKAIGRGAGKRLAIEKASRIAGVEVLVLTELEKTSLVTNCLQQIVEPIFHNKADIVIPKREDGLFMSTYPRYMYNSETEGNTIYNEALRSNAILSKNALFLDLFFGPRVFKNERHIVALFKRKYSFSGISFLEKLYDPDQYSNVQFFPIVNALRNKLQVVSVEVPFSYPKIQKENEEVGDRKAFGEKRSMQRTSILIDLMHFLSYLEKRKNSGIRLNK